MKKTERVRKKKIRDKQRLMDIEEELREAGYKRAKLVMDPVAYIRTEEGEPKRGRLLVDTLDHLDHLSPLRKAEVFSASVDYIVNRFEDLVGEAEILKFCEFIDTLEKS